MFQQWRYHFYYNAAVDILCLLSLIDLHCHLTTDYHLHNVWVTCFLSGAKMLLPSDQFHQPWSGWPWWSMMLHQLEKQNELLFFNLGPFRYFFHHKMHNNTANKLRHAVRAFIFLSSPIPCRELRGSRGNKWLFWSFTRGRRWIYVAQWDDKCVSTCLSCFRLLIVIWEKKKRKCNTTVTAKPQIIMSQSV